MRLHIAGTLLTLLILSTSALAEKSEQCELIPKVLGLGPYSVAVDTRNMDPGDPQIVVTGLSPYWAQEYTGADLLREQLLRSDLQYPKNLVAVLDADTDGDNHGKLVASLIASGDRSSLLPDIKLSDVNVDQNIRHGNQDEANIDEEANFQNFANQAASKGVYPMYINNSMGWSGSEVLYQVFATLSKGKSLTVLASGNTMDPHLLLTDPIEIKAAQEINVLLVGSASPYGFVSEFSMEAPNLSILAPADMGINVVDENGKPVLFRATSAAAPEVTATLAAFTAISGYQLGHDDALQLLQNTAIKSANTYQSPRQNGVGLLNAYKIGQVAFRLKGICTTAQNFTSCMQNGLRDGSSYQFSADSNLAAAKAAFPNCFDSASIASDFSTCDKLESFKKLRSAALLTGDPALYKGIACIYSGLGYFINAKYFQNLAALNQAPDSSFLLELIKGLKDVSSEYAKHVSISIARTLGGLSTTDESVVNELLLALRDADMNVRAAAALASEGTAKTSGALQLALWKNIDPYIQTNKDSDYAAFILGKIQPSNPQFLQAMVDELLGSTESTLAKIKAIKPRSTPLLLAITGQMTKAPRAASAILTGITSIDRQVLLSIAKYAHDSNPIVRQASIQSLASVDPRDDELLSVVVGALKDDDPLVCTSAVATLSRIAPTNPQVLLGIVDALMDPNFVVQMQAEISLRMINNSPDGHQAIQNILNSTDLSPDKSAALKNLFKSSQ